MRLSVALLGASIAVSAAQPHHHGHHHLHQHKRDSVVVAGTEVVYVLNGEPIPEWEVDQGLKNGTLVLADDGQLAAAPTTSAWSAPTTSAARETSTSSAPASTSEASTTTTAAAPSADVKTNSDSWSSSGTGLQASFPDGEIDCSVFPSAYGAVAVDWLGLGGWTGVQNPGSQLLQGFADILTVTPGGSCTEGSFCSYACPAGYQKSQWPPLQGATGQSVGGLKCSGGKLHLTNPGLSTSLCIQGDQTVEVLVVNKLSQNVAVCRTDYPGTESETVPVNVPGQGKETLTCPNGDTYYKHEGASTSAQYYVNPAGVSVQDACQWGSAANPWGNYAPLNLGVGYSNGNAWLSIFQNAPTTQAKLQFNVEIVAAGSGSLSGSCNYTSSTGEYCGATGCSGSTGCTASIASGTVMFVFSD